MPRHSGSIQDFLLPHNTLLGFSKYGYRLVCCLSCCRRQLCAHDPDKCNHLFLLLPGMKSLCETLGRKMLDVTAGYEMRDEAVARAILS